MKKKIFSLVAFVLIIASMATSCVYSTTTICNHSYQEDWREEATCESTGYIVYKCTLCGNEYTEYNAIPKLEHVYEEEYADEPSCASTGDIEYVCTDCGHTYTDYNAVPRSEHEWIEATCTSAETCSECGVTQGYSLGHQYSKKNGLCTECGYGTKIILPSTPQTVYEYSYSGDCSFKIESMEIRYNSGYYYVDYVVQMTYHEKGNNYSDSISFGWKLYDKETGFVVQSGSDSGAASIKVGEKTTGSIGFGSSLKEGKTYRLEILNLV